MVESHLPAVEDIESAARDLADQARRTVDAGRPLFVLVIYADESQKTAFLLRLRRLLFEQGLESQTLDPAHRAEHGLGTFYQAVEATRPACVSLVSSLPLQFETGASIGAEFLTYLNLHRDRIARGKLRIVLCLHRDDLAPFARAAGDLWDFRQRTVWLEPTIEPLSERLWLRVDTAARELPLSDLERTAMEDHVARVRAQVAETPAARDRARLLLDLTHWLQRRSASESAAYAAAEALGQASEPDQQAEAEVALAAALNELRQHSEALLHFEKALQLSLERNDLRSAATTLREIARVQSKFDQREQALASLERSLGYSREVGELRSQGDVLHEIAQLHYQFRRNEDALDALEQALAIFRKLGHGRDEAIALGNRGQIRYALGDLDEAAADSEQSLHRFHLLGDRLREALALNNLAGIRASQGRFDEAEQLAQRALSIREQLEDRAGVAGLLSNLASIYFGAGRFEAAVVNLERSLEISQQIGDQGLEMRVRRTLSSVREEQRDFGAALAHAERTATISQALGTGEVEGDRARIRELRAKLGATPPQPGSDTPSQG